MKDYKKWTAAEREKSLALTNEAKRRGLLLPPTKCRICGQTRGILHTHNTNYDATLAYVPKMLEGTATPEEVQAVHDALMPICWTCHMMLHRGEKHPASWQRYLAMVEVKGYQAPPVFKPNAWEVLDKYKID